MLAACLLGPVVSNVLCSFFASNIGPNVLKLVLITYLMSTLSSLCLLYGAVVNDTTQMISISS